eukprot:m.203020 g.203020  ORF g.203020 m.203020 type:complete len:77 (-) comp22007_c0_seq1:462-692(-)
MPVSVAGVGGDMMLELGRQGDNLNRPFFAQAAPTVGILKGAPRRAVCQPPPSWPQSGESQRHATKTGVICSSPCRE